MSDELSVNQKLALLDGGHWINMPAAVLLGEEIKTIVLPRYDKKLMVKDFLSCKPFDDTKRNYQITRIPNYEYDDAEIDQLINIHIVAKNLVAPFMEDLPEDFPATAKEKAAALVRFLKL